ncbi:hypothetical protein ACFV99_36145 [Streptomyces sp. NPDC059944]|uniref:hypothetical protein n=1 Tax=unclassified Streptomyces TaxID=2593676 RepID=UPI0036544F3A
MSDADAVDLHLSDPAQDVFLEQHYALDAALRDQHALVTAPPLVCARAQSGQQSVTVADLAGDPDLDDHPAGQALQGAGLRTGTPSPWRPRRASAAGR